MKKSGELFSNLEKRYAELLAKEALFTEVFNNINTAIAIFEVIDKGKDFVFKDINKAAEKIEKVKKKDLLGKSVKEVFPQITTIGLLDIFKKVYETGEAENLPISLCRDNKISSSRENYIFKLPSEEIVVLYEDSTKLKQAYEEIKICEEKYKDLFESSIDGIYQSTIEGKYIDANPALVKILGYDNKEELIKIDIPTQLYAHKEDRPRQNNRNRLFETKLKKKDGSVIDVEISSKVIYKNNEPAFYAGIVRDITQRKKFEEKLKFLSFHDKLTELYNRAYFEEELKRVDTVRQLPLSIIIADINCLKLVNDAFGHSKGDALLRTCARIFKKCFRKEDIIARWGGDEFAMLLPLTTQQKTIEIKNRIIVECQKAAIDKNIPVSISIGSSTKTTEEKDINTVIIEAEEQMYQSKLTESKNVSNAIITSLSKALSEKGIETKNHINKTGILAMRLGRSLNLSENQLNELHLLSFLHNIGKIVIPDEILLKKDNLSESDWKIIKRHPQIGYNIIRSSSNLAHIADAILAHHECWDGSGYPQGLQKEDIPITSRIISVVSTYDLIANGRAYKQKVSHAAAVEELKNGAGKQFDPYIVKKFLQIL
ncbi:MAG: diguanylate cyclase [Actinomycetota bacterium]|nr:diguanylate cyclase [Actinomycetota bacterium]